MHQLRRESLHLEKDADRFFARYLGESIRQKFERPVVGFSNWPVAMREALRALCVHFAEAVPEADHVVREDVDSRGRIPPGVDGELLLYFGYQLSGPGQRSQFAGVALAGQEETAKLVMYIGGSTHAQRREELISAEDPRRVLEGRAIICVADVIRLTNEAASVLQTQRDALIAQKGVSTSGFCPAFCQHRADREDRRPEQEAREKVSAYWNHRKLQISPEQARRERELLQENNRYRYGRAVAYVRDRVSVEEAYSLALSEHS